MRVFFLTGSDTDVGKTYLISQLIQHLQSLGLKALAIKPIETGVNPIAHDANIHLKNAQKLFPTLTLQDITLYTFPLPASPFVADERGVIECERIFSHISSFEGKVDILIVEGAGGLFVPIKKDYFMLDFALELQERLMSEVVFVCDDRLGMINRLLSGVHILQSKKLLYHLLINIREEKTFQKLSSPFLQVWGERYYTSHKAIADELLGKFQ
ncbi:dethiobiotin synthase [uncultured Helicobacter sp.]|uniref:dethiobiotin synthase n=1 Tax=uncultured Helicobacter sp. TaxID=175537 RepID=UPI002616AD3C|nr:dethiobiotin synthase [uncultured Helicobacter sp.]